MIHKTKREAQARAAELTRDRQIWYEAKRRDNGWRAVGDREDEEMLFRSRRRLDAIRDVLVSMVVLGIAIAFVA